MLLNFGWAEVQNNRQKNVWNWNISLSILCSTISHLEMIKMKKLKKTRRSRGGFGLSVLAFLTGRARSWLFMLIFRQSSIFSEMKWWNTGLPFFGFRKFFGNRFCNFWWANSMLSANRIRLCSFSANTYEDFDKKESGQFCIPCQGSIKFGRLFL